MLVKKMCKKRVGKNYVHFNSIALHRLNTRREKLCVINTRLARPRRISYRIRIERSRRLIGKTGVVRHIEHIFFPLFSDLRKVK